MNTQTPFGLAPGHFAQPAIESKSAVFNGQNLVDAFADCDMEQCEKIAALLARGRRAEAGELLEKIVQDWYQPN